MKERILLNERRLRKSWLNMYNWFEREFCCYFLLVMVLKVVKNGLRGGVIVEK